jgi:aspartyl-tRNA(Asn)/glutamyl-tRNA(Gln) amidotransferase subunit C|tara:strand:+ start:55 stop:357 length:303 start_codon:yes stop_codon:yes gene_type:complete
MSDKKISVEEVRHIAHLSKIEIPDNKLSFYANEMGKILEYFKKLSSVDTTDVKPMTHVSDSVNVTREDVITECISNKEFLDNCPDSFGQYIKVPKVLDKA